MAVMTSLGRSSLWPEFRGLLHALPALRTCFLLAPQLRCRLLSEAPSDFHRPSQMSLLLGGLPVPCSQTVPLCALVPRGL